VVYAVAIGDLLGFNQVVATRAAWDHHRIAGGFEGANLVATRNSQGLSAHFRCWTNSRRRALLPILTTIYHSCVLLMKGLPSIPRPRLKGLRESTGSAPKTGVTPLAASKFGREAMQAPSSGITTRSPRALSQELVKSHQKV
jgi:hypothetical protein